jgi:dihydroorotate dehydrogenase (NAD+) catalytic subunit
MIELTRPGKHSLVVENPVMNAAGTLGFGDSYRDLIDVEKLGALVTNPVTYQPWQAASGTRVVPLDSGVLVHTGLPNPGVSKVLTKYHELWNKMPLPIILHLVVNSADEISKSVPTIDREESVDAIELGLNDDLSAAEAQWYVQAVTKLTDKPVLVRVPFVDAEALAHAAADGGAGGVVVCAPPRGTARDPQSGRLIGGRLYGPFVKPLILRLVGQLARKIGVPIIGAGGIHTPQDGRDYIEAGARAVQIDSVAWVRPKVVESILKDLGGLATTQVVGSFPE